jgi:hypothetical protein
MTDYLFVSNNSNRLMIYNSGMGNSVVFEWQGTFKKLNINADALFLKDTTNSFYTKGIKGFSISEDDTVNKILELGNYNRYDLISTSMGSYASIVIARKLAKLKKNINILVFNPYINVNKSEHKNKVKCICNLSTEEDTYDGKKIIIVSDSKKELEQVNYLNKDKWTINIIYGCDNHNVALWLKEKNRLYPILEDFLE